MSTEIFRENFEVRDNEIDIQGIVNNTHYMVYLAHARHKYIHKMGIDFVEYARNGKNLVVLSCNLTFKQALRPNDKFYVTCEARPSDSPIRFAFYQEVRLSENDKLALTAEFVATCINEKATTRAERIYVPEDIKKLYQNNSNETAI